MRDLSRMCLWVILVASFAVLASGAHAQTTPASGTPGGMGAAGTAEQAAASAPSARAATAAASVPAEAHGLPIADPGAAADDKPFGVRCLLSLEQLQAAIQDGPAGGLRVDLSGVTRLLDGSAIRAADIHGAAHIGIYPPEEPGVVYTYKRFSATARIEAGKAILPVGELLLPGPDGKRPDRGRIAVRLELYQARDGQDRALGVYDTFSGFGRQDEGFKRLPCLVDGPFISRVTSDDPTSAVVTFQTSHAVQAAVVLNGKQAFGEPGPALRHEIALTGLQPGREATYRVDLPGGIGTTDCTFSPAPPRGLANAIFAFIGDTGAAPGGGANDWMGVNTAAVERMFSQAQRLSARFVIAGGNLVSGRTSRPEDLRMQLSAWKQAAVGYGRSRPIFTLMGAGESLLRAAGASGGKVLLDRWPYATDSAEAVFADAFANPLNAPAAADPRRPSYRGSVYSFQYGPVRIICLNNNYWYSSDPKIRGGCPEGYILPDQMAWLKQELAAAEEDATVRYSLVFLAQPVLPNGGRLSGGMWAGGNNTLRPYQVDPATGRLEPVGPGLLEMRNELLRATDRCRKLGAVVSSGEHAYHRTLVGNQVPVGDPARDDKGNTGRLGPEPSPLTDLEHPTWFIVSGGAGEPLEAEQAAPWNEFWKLIARIDAARPPEKRRYRYAAQDNFLVFSTTGDVLTLSVFTPYGDLVERINDLIKYKRETPRTKCCED